MRVRHVEAGLGFGAFEPTFLHIIAGLRRYPTVCNTAFSALNCKPLSESVQVLVADDTIVCSDILGVTGVATTQASNFHVYQIFSVGVIVAFGVGVPLGFLIYICCATRDVDDSVWEDRAERRAIGDAGHASVPSRTGTNSSLYDKQTDSISQRMAIDLEITADRALGSFQELSTLSNMSNLTESYNPKYPCEQSPDGFHTAVLYSVAPMFWRIESL